MTKSLDSVKPWSTEHHTILLQRVQSSQLPWIQFLTPEACINRGEQILISSPSWWQNWVPELQQDPTTALPWRWRTPTRNPGDRVTFADRECHSTSPSVRICLCFHLRVSCFMWFVVWDVICHLLKTTFWPLPAFSWEFHKLFFRTPPGCLAAANPNPQGTSAPHHLKKHAIQVECPPKKRYSTSEQMFFWNVVFFIAVFWLWDPKPPHCLNDFMLGSDLK